MTLIIGIVEQARLKKKYWAVVDSFNCCWTVLDRGSFVKDPESTQTRIEAVDMANNGSLPRISRLADSAYSSPYAKVRVPLPHLNSDPYVPLRAKALANLESMGYDDNPARWKKDGRPWHWILGQFRIESRWQ